MLYGPEELKNMTIYSQMLSWAIDFKALSSFILASEWVLIWLTILHSSLIAH